MYITIVVVLYVNVMATNRDREPSREPMNMLKRLSQKSRKLPAELCVEPIEEKRTTIIESSSSY